MFHLDKSQRAVCHGHDVWSHNTNFRICVSVKDWMTLEPWFDWQQRKQFSLFSKPPRPALLATRFHRWQGGQGVKFNTKLYLIPRLRMSGDKPPLPHTRSWRGEVQFYLLNDCLFCCNVPTTCVSYESNSLLYRVYGITHTHIQCVPEGMCQTSGGCSLC
jgi:hypothetical protein